MFEAKDAPQSETLSKQVRERQPSFAAFIRVHWCSFVVAFDFAGLNEMMPHPRTASLPASRSRAPLALAILGAGNNFAREPHVFGDLKVEHAHGGKVSPVFKGVL